MKWMWDTLERQMAVGIEAWNFGWLPGENEVQGNCFYVCYKGSFMEASYIILLVFCYASFYRSLSWVWNSKSVISTLRDVSMRVSSS